MRPIKHMVAHWWCGKCKIDWDSREGAKACCRCIRCHGEREGDSYGCCSRCKAEETLEASTNQIERSTRARDHALATIESLKVLKRKKSSRKRSK